MPFDGTYPLFDTAFPMWGSISLAFKSNLIFLLVIDIAYLPRLDQSDELLVVSGERGRNGDRMNSRLRTQVHAPVLS